MAEGATAEAPAGRSAPGPLGPWGLVAIGLGLVALAALVFLSREQRLTILVVSLDPPRPDHLSAYGHERLTSPTLARLAQEGVLFSNARSSTSWTLPAHMSLFTGLPPDLHNVVLDFHRLDAGRRTLGEVFKEADFRTVGLFTAPYVHKRFGFDRGMDFYEAATNYPMAYDLTPAEMNRQMGKLEKVSHLEVTSDLVTGKALWFLEQRSRPRTFLFLHYFDPHYDYLPRPLARRAIVDETYRGPVTGRNVTVDPVVHAGMEATDLDHLQQLYDAEIRWVDSNLAELVNVLDSEEHRGSTIVVVTGDHGEEFFEHGRFGHRMGLYDEVLRVPLIVWGPGIIPAGRVVDDEVALYDVLPTLMDYAGIEPDDDIYGRSLRPLIEGRGLEPRPTTAALTFLHRPGPDGRPLDYYTRHDALVYQGMKYLRRLRVPWSKDDPLRLDNEPDLASAEIEVYDLRADPGETTDLYRSSAGDPRVLEITDVFTREQRRQREAFESMLQLGAPALEHDALRGLDPYAALRATGYLNGGAEESGVSGPPPPESTSGDAAPPPGDGPPGPGRR